jgi:hypothetical protein
MPDAIDLATYTVPPGRALILRTCDKDMRSYGGFQWPWAGPVAAPDRRPVAECGGGLHGFLRGEGDGALASWAADAVWVVAEIFEAEAIDLGGKVKVPAAVVLFAGNRLGATDLIRRHYPAAAVVGGTATAGDCGTATAGYRGTATAGCSGTATAGNFGTATAGNFGTATAGNRGTATAGYRGTATAGYRGTATAGYRGTATAGDCGTATAGNCGTLAIKWHDGARYRLAVGYVGEAGIVAGKPYRLGAAGEFVPADAG